MNNKFIKTDLIQDVYKTFIKDGFNNDISFEKKLCEGFDQKTIRRHYLEFTMGIFAPAIMAFMISTRFQYSSFEDIKNSEDMFFIKNDNKKTYDLFLLFLANIMQSKKCFKNFNEIRVNSFIIKPDICKNIDDFIKMVYNYRKHSKEDLFFNNHWLDEYIKIYGTSSTSMKIVKKMVDNINYENKQILDPCCGRGIFLYNIKEKLLENKSEDKIMKQLHGYDNNICMCYLAQSIIDYDKKFEPIIEYKNSLAGEYDLKFDVIIGNPPYNRGLIKKDSPLWKHKAMDHSRSGHIGFLIHCLDFLNEGGILEFITPAKFLMDVNSIDTRQYLFENFNVEEVKYYECKDVFPNVSIETIVVFKIRKGKTNIIKTNYKDFSYNIKLENYPNYIVPKFNNNLLSIYQKMLSKNIGFFPKFVNYNLKDDHNKFGKYYSLEKNTYYKNKTLIEFDKDKIIYGYIHLKTNNRFWRCITKEIRSSNFMTLEPDIETNYTFYSIPCKNKQESDNIVKYSETHVFKILKEYFRTSISSQCWLSNIPMVDFHFDNEKKLYEYFDFSQEEIEYIENNSIIKKSRKEQNEI